MPAPDHELASNAATNTITVPVTITVTVMSTVTVIVVVDIITVVAERPSRWILSQKR